MKKHLIIVVLIGFAASMQAQQLAMFTEYMNNEVTLNPAYAGSHEVISATALGRRQWVGKDFKGAPETYSFNVHSPLRNQNIGVGFSFIHDQMEAQKNENAMLSLSYKVAFKNSDLHFGLQAGAAYSQTDYGSLDIYNLGDPNLISGGSGILPNFGLGAYYFAKQFYLGVSAPQLLNNQLKVNGNEIASQKRHLFVSTGYLFNISPILKFKPTLFFKYVKAVDPEFDFTGSLIFYDKVWIGGAFRTGFNTNSDAASLLVGLQATEQLKISYAYDLTRSDLNAFTKGSHELVVNYRFSFSKGKIITPRYF
jgi:type IX secretion system PorP/SprF family membrane protein